MHVCPKSAPARYIIGQAPAITLIPCWRQYSTASGETLDPFPNDWCIHTRGTPTSLQSRTIRSVVSGRVMITTPSTPPGIDPEVWIAAIAFEGPHVRIHREHVVPGRFSRR